VKRNPARWVERIAGRVENCERAFSEEGDDASFERMVSMREALAQTEGMDALIEGFGLPSGRPARSF